MDEAALVQRVLAGDNSAFAPLVEAYQGKLYGLACHLLGDRDEAEDAAQEAFLRAYRQLGSFRTEQRFGPWLLAICAHYCVDRLRRRRFHWLRLGEEALAERLVSHEAGPEETTLAKESEGEVRRLLDGLPERYRTVTVLRYVYDLSVAQIATSTGTSEGAVKTQLCRARQMLAAQMPARTAAAGAARTASGASAQSKEVRSLAV
jgi:RNA polymerase sigma-70 factor (ECF subfamily)